MQKSQWHKLLSNNLVYMPVKVHVGRRSILFDV